MARKKKILANINNQTWLDKLYSRYSFTVEDCVLGTKNIPNSYNSQDTKNHSFYTELTTDKYIQTTVENELLNNAILFKSNTGYTTYFEKDGDKSISIWFKITEEISGNHILGNDKWYFYITADTLSFWDTQSIKSTNICPIALNQWYNLCISYSNTVIAVYLNGQAINQITYIDFNTNELFIGRNMKNNYIGGPVYFINKAITTEEVKEIYGIKTKIINGKKLLCQSIEEKLDDSNITDSIISNPTIYANGTVALGKIDEYNTVYGFAFTADNLTLKRSALQEEVFEEI